MRHPSFQKRLPRCVDGVGKAHGGNDFGETGEVMIDAIDDVNRGFNAGRKFRFWSSRIDFDDNMLIAVAMRLGFVLDFDDDDSD